MKRRRWQVRPSVRQMGMLQRILIGLLLVGAGLVVLGVALLVDNQRFVARAASATGRVVDVHVEVRTERQGSGDNERYVDVTYYYPIVQFLTAREQLVRFQGNDGSLRVGQSVKVLYDPANPHDARLDSWPSRWGAGAVPIAIGLFLILISVSAMLYRQLRSAGPGRTTTAPQTQHPLSARLLGGWRRRRGDHHNGTQGAGGGAGPTPAP